MQKILMENRVLRIESSKSGILEDFDIRKIIKSILDSAKRAGGLLESMNKDSPLILLNGKKKKKKERVYAEMLANIVVSNLNSDPRHWTSHHPPTTEQVHDAVIQVLYDWGFPSVSNAYCLYREGRRLVHRGLLKEEEFMPIGTLPEKMEEMYSLYESFGIKGLGDFRKLVEDGKLVDFFHADTERYEADVSKAVNHIVKTVKKHPGEVIFVIVAGPSSSGKSTTAKKIGQAVEALGTRFYLFAGDDYFYNPSTQPSDWYGDRKFEVPQAINLGQLKKDLFALREGKTISPFEFDFHNQQSRRSKKTVNMRSGGVVVLDSLHGMYINRLFDLNAITVYIECFSGIPGLKHTDKRLLRRTCRDIWSRSWPIRRTLEHWRTIREGELQCIIPFQKSADFVVNGSIGGELPILKYFLEKKCKFRPSRRYLNVYLKDGRVHTYRRGKRLFEILRALPVIDPSLLNHISKDNLLREFIGDAGL